MIAFIYKTLECMKYWNKATDADEMCAYLSSDKLLSKDELLYVYEKIGYTRAKYLINKKLYPISAGAVISEKDLLEIKPFGIPMKLNE